MPKFFINKQLPSNDDRFEYKWEKIGKKMKSLPPLKLLINYIKRIYGKGKYWIAIVQKGVKGWHNAYGKGKLIIIK